MSYDSPRSLRPVPASGVSLALSPQRQLVSAPSTGAKVDSNMNKALPNNNLDAVQKSRLPILASSLIRDVPTPPPAARRVSTLETAVPSHKLGFDMPSVVSMEILESQQQQPEARNDAVIQRVSELKRLVEDAEQYLTGGADRSSRASDVETSSLLSDMSQLSKAESDLSGSGAGAGYGRLRHSDSLLLLTQAGQKQLSLPDNSTVILLDDATDHASSSDTDSVSTTPNMTPTHSPSQRPKSSSDLTGKAGQGHLPPRPPSLLKPSDSSFGLHSPDMPLPIMNGITGEEKELEGLLRRLQDDLPLAEGSLLYLDPDIIDLTMIPPPITPEEDGLKMKFPATINEPPTPFADRDSLENELAAMKQQRKRLNPSDLGELRDLTDLAQWTEVVSDASSCLNQSRDERDYTDDNSSEDTLSLSGISASAHSIESLASSGTASSSLAIKTLTESKRRWIADEKRKHLTANPGLDKFLSTVDAPPSPVAHRRNGGAGPRHEQVGSAPNDFSSEDLSAYIIPPPPANVGSSSSNGLAILQKLYAAREGISQVMRDDPAPPAEEKDRGMAEMRVQFEQREPHHPGVSSKIGEIQRMLSSAAPAGSNNLAGSPAVAPSIIANGSVNTKGTTPDLSPASSHSSGYGSIKSIADCSNNAPPPELPARQPAGQFSPRKNGFANFKPLPQLNRTNGALIPPSSGSTTFRPTFINDVDDDDIPPPPPPPRNPLPRMIIAAAAASGSSSRIPPPAKKAEVAPPPPGPLTKSSSQVRFKSFISCLMIQRLKIFFIQFLGRLIGPCCL